MSGSIFEQSALTPLRCSSPSPFLRNATLCMQISNPIISSYVALLDSSLKYAREILILFKTRFAGQRIEIGPQDL